MRQLAFKLLSILFGFAFVAVFLEIGLRFLPYNSGMIASHVNESQPVYRFVADMDVQYSQDWDMKNARTRHVNMEGFLSDIEYDRGGSGPLLAVIGDSFVEAIQVDWEESVHGRLNQAAGDNHRVYAFGAAYAALAQYLAWADYARQEFKPRMLVVNIVANDFLQQLPSEGGGFKGGFHGMQYFDKDEKGNLILHPSTRPPESLSRRLLRKSALVAYLYRNAQITAVPQKIKNLYAQWTRTEEEAPAYIANTVAQVDPEDLQLSQQQIDRFLTLLDEKAGLPRENIVITLDGLRPDLYDAESLEASRSSFPAQMADYLVSQARAQGYEMIPLQPKFIARHQQDDSRFEFPFNNHWNATGHEVMAQAVLNSQTYQRVMLSK